jgi:hypothetical protein
VSPAAATARLAVALAIVGALGRTASADPATDYMLHCRGCHGPTGYGAPGAVPSFQGELAKFLAVPGGREYLVRVPGTSQSELGDGRVAALLNWMVAEFDPAHAACGFEPYTAEEVARLRRPPLVDVESVRRGLMDAIAHKAPAACGR